jgi:hypothetical protein
MRRTTTVSYTDERSNGERSTRTARSLRRASIYAHRVHQPVAPQPAAAVTKGELNLKWLRQFILLSQPVRNTRASAYCLPAIPTFCPGLTCGRLGARRSVLALHGLLCTFSIVVDSCFSLVRLRSVRHLTNLLSDRRCFVYTPTRLL